MKTIGFIMNDGLSVFIWVVAIVSAVATTIASYKRPSPSSPPSGFTGLFEILFSDIRFKFFTLRKFVSAVYFVLVMFAVAFIVMGVISLPFLVYAVKPYTGYSEVFQALGFIFIPIAVVVVARFVLESMIAVIKIAENTSVIAAASTKETAS